MPTNESQDRYQDAGYWAANGFDAFGQPTVAAMVAIVVRVEEGESDVLDESGNTIKTSATINVDREIPIGSILWIGDTSVATPSSDFLKVVAYESIPDLKNQKYDRNVKVSRYGDTLPTIV